MVGNEALNDQKKRINSVVVFLLKNVGEENSLEKLASLAHYSPFHFQRVFKQIGHESPKQYATRARLENACHSVFVHQHKTIAAIAAEHGFSSPAVFARAFKAHFGVSAEAFRKSGMARKNVHRWIGNGHQHNVDTTIPNEHYDKKYWSKHLAVAVARLPQYRVFSVSATLADPLQIREAYKRVVQVAGIYNLLPEEPQFLGIVNPHQGTYWASIVVATGQPLPDDLTTFTLEAGKYACFNIKGDTVTTFHSLHAFYELWLLQSGYHIRNLFGIELLFKTPYSRLIKKLKGRFAFQLNQLKNYTFIIVMRKDPIQNEIVT